MLQALPFVTATKGVECAFARQPGLSYRAETVQSQGEREDLVQFWLFFALILFRCLRVCCVLLFIYTCLWCTQSLRFRRNGVAAMKYTKATRVRQHNVISLCACVYACWCIYCLRIRSVWACHSKYINPTQAHSDIFSTRAI